MENQKLKIEDILKEIESTELNVLSLLDFNETAPEVNSLQLRNSDIVRIEENVPFGWSGVTGCNNNERAQSEYRKTLAEWVKNKMYEYRNWRWIRYGSSEATGRCSQYDDIWTGRRCNCRGTLKCFIEFRKP